MVTLSFSYRLLAAVLGFLGMAVAASGQSAMQPEHDLFAGRVLDPVEGIWQFPGDGAVLRVCRKSATSFEIALLDSPSLDIEPGIVIGEAVASPKAGHYDAHLQSGKLGEKRIKRSTVEMVITDAGGLQFKPYREGMGISVKRWFYRIFKVSLVDGSAPADLTGAVKIYPVDMSAYKPCL